MVGGCATTEQIAKIQTTADNALETANNAMNKVNNVQSTTNATMDATRAAQAAADSAKACCSDNATKLDRMFEKAMQK